MLLDKVRRGILEVSTENGSRYYRPSFGARLQLLWTFRNFNVLPEGVLNENERKIVEELCEEASREQKAAARAAADLERDLIIGIVEREPALGKKLVGKAGVLLQRRA
jgi:hypothetical protein